MLVKIKNPPNFLADSGIFKKSEVLQIKSAVTFPQDPRQAL